MFTLYAFLSLRERGCTINMKILKCPTCGKEFEWSEQHKKYCSDECFRINRLLRKKIYQRKALSTPEQRKKRAQYTREWQKKNRDKWNAYQAQYRKDHKRKEK